ncbi:ATP-binding protein [Armatimonas rosea]|uniref:Putative ATPase n=1 Tax=Armatimonas rosea TaxID=685828 RepID=A0A7W9SNN9_ARMRO|nr:hypothetical protein [Armatimonas rosea]MBB6049972.1 putative ATPase [Armatimonas rosea]
MESVATTWFIELFGELRAVCAEKSVEKFRTDRCRLLLAILAARPERMHPREELGDLLWPDEDDRPLQLQRLRGELSELGTSLGKDIFEKSGNRGVKVRSGIASDVSRFDQLFLTAARATPEQRLPALEAAAALYKDDLLPSRYDDWTIRERERLKVVYCDVLTRLVLDLEAVGRADEARALRHELVSRFPDLAAPPAPTTAGAPALGGDGYYGREEKILEVREWRGRLLTITGPGGMGKTRLSKQALSPPAPTGEGAIFVPLAEVSDAKSGFFEAIHAALALPKGDAPPRDQVVYALRQKTAPLLILDNFEQIVTHGAPLVARLLKDVPALRCLVTSRRRLGIAGEQELPLEPLPHAPSVALFLDRARRARPDFAQNPSALPLVEEIVALLQGLPLAIELAAARSVVLGPMQMRDQLASHLRFLVNRRHASNERHRSLRAALDWSIHLLSPELKRIFARLSVFRGGWSLEAAETVCQGCDMEVLNALDELHSHSLITVAFDETETPRYDMLVVIREYAEELLAKSGELEETKAQHAQSVEEMAQRVQVCFKEQGVGPMQRLLSKDLDNLRRGMDWAEKAKRYDLLYSWLHMLGGKLFEGEHWRDFERLMDSVDGHIEDERALMRFCSLRGALLRRQGKEDAAALYWDRWLELAERLQDTEAQKWALVQLIDQYIFLGRTEGACIYLEKYKIVDNDFVNIGYFEMMIDYKNGKKDELIKFAKKEMQEKLGDMKDLTMMIEYASILIENGHFRVVGSYINSVIDSILSSGNKFISAKIANLMGECFEHDKDIKRSYLCYEYAARSHAELGSRNADSSKKKLHEFLTRHKNVPEWGLLQGQKTCYSLAEL